MSLMRDHRAAPSHSTRRPGSLKTFENFVDKSNFIFSNTTSAALVKRRISSTALVE